MLSWCFLPKIEKIRGEPMLRLLTELQLDNIPLKIQLTNSDDPYMTYIADIRKRRRTDHFLVPPPEDFQKLSENSDRARLRFEFIDQENIKYVFESHAWKLSRDMIWVRFPEFIHRFQRRKLFRLETPHGTRLYFTAKDIRYKLLVINVSLGGTLGVLVSLNKQVEQELKLYESKILKNVELVFPSKDRKKKLVKKSRKS
jgi:c-di-GMP-binding flagellar brake protein YcgR